MLTPCFLGLSCGLFDPSVANGTSLFIVMHYAQGITPDQLQVTVSGGGTPIYPTETVPASANGALSSPQSLRVLLDDKWAGQPVQVTVDGLQGGKVVGSDGAHPTPVQGKEIEVDLTLGQVRVACAGIVGAIQSGFANCAGGPQAGWAAYFPADLTCARIEKSVSLGQEDFDGSKVQDCIQGLTQTSCSVYAQVFGRILAGEFDFYWLTCPAFAPRVTSGGACSFDWDCVGGWCDTHSTCPGVCTSLKQPNTACGPGDRCVAGTTCASAECVGYAGSGAPCGGANPPCEPSQLYCGPSSTCIPRQTSGSCTSGSQCALKYDCVGPAGTTTCQPQAQESGDCSVESCELFTYCSAVKKCRIWPSNGQLCNAICLAQCCSALLAGTCSDCPPAGSHCNWFFDCPPLTYCASNQTCRPYICAG